ncbi:MAG: hypothetical protein HOV81_06965 [Kofleriaceae bacterium]|nr:hypothetical protein [Kofleriaceae bacterium]
MKNLAFVLLLVACGPKQPTTSVSNAGGNSAETGPVQDSRSELERRRDAACDTLGPRMTNCALADAKAALAAGKVTQQQFDQDTKSAVLEKNTDEFIKTCKNAQYSSRQVRVLEVCQREESECEPMLACLDNLNAEPKVKSVGP